MIHASLSLIENSSCVETDQLIAVNESIFLFSSSPSRNFDCFRTLLRTSGEFSHLFSFDNSPFLIIRKYIISYGQHTSPTISFPLSFYLSYRVGSCFPFSSKITFGWSTTNRWKFVNTKIRLRGNMYTNAISSVSYVLLTGPPGIGKTTVCMNIVSILEKQNRTLDGFYTEEVRGINGNRIGFDIVLIKDKEKRIPLARTQNVLSPKEFSKHRVGNYHVFVNNLEKSVLPVIKNDTDILLIDEIGKMEMYSKKFHDEISNIFFGSSNKKTFIIATIPEKHKIPRFPEIFQKLHEDKRFKIINVNRANRNILPNEIVSTLS